MTRCKCPVPVYRLERDGRKPIRCNLCGRRAFKRQSPLDRLLPWLAWHFPRLASWVLR